MSQDIAGLVASYSLGRSVSAKIDSRAGVGNQQGNFLLGNIVIDIVAIRGNITHYTEKRDQTVLPFGTTGGRTQRTEKGSSTVCELITQGLSRGSRSLILNLLC